MRSPPLSISDSDERINISDSEFHDSDSERNESDTGLEAGPETLDETMQRERDELWDDPYTSSPLHNSSRFVHLKVTYIDDDTREASTFTLLFGFLTIGLRLATALQGYETILADLRVHIDKRVSVALIKPVTVTALEFAAAARPGDEAAGFIPIP